MSYFHPLFWPAHRKAKAGGTKTYKEELMGAISRDITSIDIPEGVTHIGSSAFAYCYQMGSVTLPGTVQTIDTNAFNNNDQIVSLVIPSSVTMISHNGFANCNALAEVTFLGTPKSLLNTAFANCTNLLTINVPWAEGKVANAPWGATNATIHYNYAG